MMQYLKIFLVNTETGFTAQSIRIESLGENQSNVLKSHAENKKTRSNRGSSKDYYYQDLISVVLCFLTS